MLLLIACAGFGCAQQPAGTSRAGQAGDEPLENTYWKLTHLGGKPVVVAKRQREPHFILHPAKKDVSGSGGCNRIMGSYELKGDQLTFRKMASTMMACLKGMDTEQALHAALQKVSRARIAGQKLELLDASEAVVARFEAVHLR